MLKIGYYLLIAVLGAALTGCSDERRTVEARSVDITLAFDFTFEENVDTRSYAGLLKSGYDIRYVIDVCEPGTAKALERHVFTDNSVTEGANTYYADINLAPAQYTIIAWVDFVKQGSKADYHYKTSDGLDAIVIQSSPYAGSTDTRDAFSGTMDIDIPEEYILNYNEPFEVKIELERPFGKFRVVSRDISEYRNIVGIAYEEMKPDMIKISYGDGNLSENFPYGYNARLRQANNFRKGVWFESPSVEERSGEITLAFDYVFVMRDRAPVFMFMEIYDPSGARISRSQFIRVPIERNRVTTIYGHFLTSSSGSDGMTIQDGFDGVIDYPIE